jgi:hypothetical protein
MFTFIRNGQHRLTKGEQAGEGRGGEERKGKEGEGRGGEGRGGEGRGGEGRGREGKGREGRGGEGGEGRGGLNGYSTSYLTPHHTLQRMSLTQHSNARYDNMARPSPTQSRHFNI